MGLYGLILCGALVFDTTIRSEPMPEVMPLGAAIELLNGQKTPDSTLTGYLSYIMFLKALKLTQDSLGDIQVKAVNLKTRKLVMKWGSSKTSGWVINRIMNRDGEYQSVFVKFSVEMLVALAQYDAADMDVIGGVAFYLKVDRTPEYLKLLLFLGANRDTGK